MSYGFIFWGASTTASIVFILQKKILQMIYNIKPRDSCRKLFRDNQIMTFYSLYLYSLTLFVAKNKCLFDPNNAFHRYNTRVNKNLHLPSIHPMKYAKGPYVNGMKAARTDAAQQHRSSSIHNSTHHLVYTTVWAGT
jgi:hypothetical protein